MNGGWGTDEFQVETRINGVQQPNQNSIHQHQNRRNRNKPDLNGLNQFIDDDDLNEVYKQPKMENIPPSVNEHLEDQDIVSVELFEKMNANAMLTLNNKMFK